MILANRHRCTREHAVAQLAATRAAAGRPWRVVIAVDCERIRGEQPTDVVPGDAAAGGESHLSDRMFVVDRLLLARLKVTAQDLDRPCHPAGHCSRSDA